ncbi:hypothetical protein AVEN_106478-1 [Araneus ventricosus]|uniref:Uncharacterized protein n=1 Tax=Araneus ventricosus TaxID=182803 RepID=A0A4Y2ASL9_ARAVE|nr:hypothetical protein AVEN_106478-1 [Araneus ventricosus]
MNQGRTRDEGGVWHLLLVKATLGTQVHFNLSPYIGESIFLNKPHGSFKANPDYVHPLSSVTRDPSQLHAVIPSSTRMMKIGPHALTSRR